MEAYRDGMALREFLYEGPTGTHYIQSDLYPKPVGVPSEMADIIIRTLDAAAAWGIDIDKAIEEKMAYNAQREYMHGRKF